MTTLVSWMIPFALMFAWAVRRANPGRSRVGAAVTFPTLFLAGVFLQVAILSTVLQAVDWDRQSYGLTPVQLLASTSIFAYMYWWFWCTALIEGPPGHRPNWASKAVARPSGRLIGFATLGLLFWTASAYRGQLGVHPGVSTTTTGTFIRLAAQQLFTLAPAAYLLIRFWFIPRRAADDRAQSFQKSRPKSEQASWFAKAPGWNQVDTRLISLLIDRFDGDPMFEVFVHASQDCGLISRYAELTHLFEKGVGQVAALPKVAELLLQAGTLEAARFAKLFEVPRADQREMSRHYAHAMNACEASIHVEPNCLPGYVQLAVLRLMLGNTEDAAGFCRRGLEAVERMRAVPFDKSRHASIARADRDVDAIEQRLRSILAEAD